MPLTLSNRQRTRKINVLRLKEIADTVLVELAGPAAVLEINLVSPAQMAKVNESFLQHEGPTDVITFDYGEPGATLHGELFICPAVAVSQAREFRTDWRSEVVRYIVHGILHLLGHDDLETAARRRMKRRENRIMRDLARRFALSKL